MRILITVTDVDTHAALDALKAVPGIELVTEPPAEVVLVDAKRLAQLEALREQVEKAAGHDLRTPLHAISMGMSLLAADPPTAEQVDVMRRIDNAIDRISDNLDKLSELTSG